MTFFRPIAAALTATLLVAPVALFGQGRVPTTSIPAGADLSNANAAPGQIKDIGIDQKLDSQVPLDALVTGADGETRPLGEFLSGRPVILAMVYYECPMLCNMVLNGVLRGLKALPMDAGKDFDVIAVSFDPSEGPQQANAKMVEYTERYHRPSGRNGWHFLTGSEESVRRIADSVGFRYRQDPENRQWIHASGIMILTPQGKVSRYFYGVEYATRDIRLGLIEASENRIGTPVDRVMLFCFHYDPATGKYSLAAMNVIRFFAVLTVLGLIAFWVMMARSKRKGNSDERLPVTS